jgi:hypothetical protein
MGTAGREQAPWLDYDKAVVGEDTPEMQKAIEAYALHRHEGSSAENEETLARMREENYNSVSEFRFLDPSEYKDLGPRIGQIYGYDEFISKLRKIGIKCFYREMGHPQKLALWVQKNSMTEPQVACWVQRPFMIEYEQVAFDDKGLPTGSKHRGWRSCLLQMRMKELITEEQINKHFGRASGPASARYLSTMQSLRNNYGL